MSEARKYYPQVGESPDWADVMDTDIASVDPRAYKIHQASAVNAQNLKILGRRDPQKFIRNWLYSNRIAMKRAALEDPVNVAKLDAGKTPPRDTKEEEENSSGESTIVQQTSKSFFSSLEAVPSPTVASAKNGVPCSLYETHRQTQQQKSIFAGIVVRGRVM